MKEQCFLPCDYLFFISLIICKVSEVLFCCFNAFVIVLWSCTQGRVHFVLFLMMGSVIYKHILNLQTSLPLPILFCFYYFINFSLQTCPLKCKLNSRQKRNCVERSTFCCLFCNCEWMWRVVFVSESTFEWLWVYMVSNENFACVDVVVSVLALGHL